MKDFDTKKKFIELRSSGRSFNSISSELKISKQTLIEWSKEFSIEIKNLKSFQIDGLLRQAQCHLEGQLHQLGVVNKKICDEMSKRDFSNISSEKLIDIWLRFFEISKKTSESLSLSQLKSMDLTELTFQTKEEWGI